VNRQIIIRHSFRLTEKKLPMQIKTQAVLRKI